MRENDFKPGDLVTFIEDSDLGCDPGYADKIGVFVEDITEEVCEKEYIPRDSRAYHVMFEDHFIVAYSHELRLVQG